jgi:hypothetical protein
LGNGNVKRQTAQQFTAEHAENAEKGRNRGKAEPRKEAAAQWDAARFLLYVFTLASASAKASAVALRAMADKTADRPSLSHKGRGRV